MAKNKSIQIEAPELTKTEVPKTGRYEFRLMFEGMTDGRNYHLRFDDISDSAVERTDYQGYQGNIEKLGNRYSFTAQGSTDTIRFAIRPDQLHNDDHLMEVTWLDSNGETEIGKATHRFIVGARPGGAPSSLRDGTTVVRSESVPSAYTDDLAIWGEIRKSTDALRFGSFLTSITDLLCNPPTNPPTIPPPNPLTPRLLARRFLPFTDTDAYRFLKVATEAFVLANAAMVPESTTDGELLRLAESIGAVTGIPLEPLKSFQTNYLRRIGPNKDFALPYLALVYDRLGDLPLKDVIFPGFEPLSRIPEVQRCVGVLKEKVTRPLMVELIWSYWHEQGMLVQTMFAVRNRFQNIRMSPGDPLAAMEIGYLRPLNNLLWGYIQDEQHRLSLARRNYEYAHHYGFVLQGRAVPAIQPADNRAKFLEAFHNLLYLCTVYFKQDDHTDIKADAFPILHSLKEVHFVLSEGAHNQFGDLPVTSRVEMLMEQWLLARPEFREFLPQRESVAYPEAWMGPVDTMKSLQGWNATSVIFFNDLARFGEQLLLSIRYAAWSAIDDRHAAANWAKAWRSEIQGYIHAYRIVTGVDLSAEPTVALADQRRADPSRLIAQRLDEQRRFGFSAPITPARIPAAPSLRPLPSVPAIAPPRR